MYFQTNIAVAEVIPFCLSEIINDFNLLEVKMLFMEILKPVPEEENLTSFYYKQIVVFLVNQRLIYHIHIIEYISY